QLLEAELEIVAVPAQSVEVGVVEDEPAGVGGEQDEGRARHLFRIDPQATREAAHERGLARPQLPREQDDLAPSEALPERGREGHRLRLAARHVLADGRPPTARIASGSALATSPATRDSGPAAPAARSPARPCT